MTDSPIELCLDDLLRRTRADARTTRRLLDEAGDDLHPAADELEASGITRQEAESEAVRRFGPVAPIVRSTYRASFTALTIEALRAALFLAGCGLVAVGISGLVALVMNLGFGRSFVSGVSLPPFRGASVQETADDAVVLRVIAGLIGSLLLLGCRAWRRRVPSPSLLPPGLIDVLGAAAFAAGPPGWPSRLPSRPSRTTRRCRLPAQRRPGRPSRNRVLLRPRHPRSPAVALIRTARSSGRRRRARR